MNSRLPPPEFKPLTDNEHPVNIVRQPKVARCRREVKVVVTFILKEVRIADVRY